MPALPSFQEEEFTQNSYYSSLNCFIKGLSACIGLGISSMGGLAKPSASSAGTGPLGLSVSP